jgi:hypothetical protein
VGASPPSSLGEPQLPLTHWRPYGSNYWPAVSFLLVDSQLSMLESAGRRSDPKAAWAVAANRIEEEEELRKVSLLMLAAMIVAVIAGLPLFNSAEAQTVRLDYAIPNGHFFTQTNGHPAGTHPSGFSVTNEGGVRFWSEFQRLGGVQVVGYPMSRRFDVGRLCHPGIPEVGLPVAACRRAASSTSTSSTRCTWPARTTGFRRCVRRPGPWTRLPLMPASPGTR